MGCCGSFKQSNAECCGAFRETSSGVEPVVQTPADILGADLLAWYRADQGITSTPTLFEWQDISGNALHLSQATLANMPGYVMGGGPNATDIVRFDGGNDRIVNAAFDRPAPNVTPTLIWAIIRQLTWTANDRFWSFDTVADRLAIILTGVSPEIRQTNGTIVNGNTSMTLNTWGRLKVYFSGSTSDYIKFAAAVATTGASAGVNNPGAGFTLGATGSGSGPSNIEVAELFVTPADLSVVNEALINAYVLDRYGAGLT